MPFCFLIQNFVEIGQSVDESWPKKRISRWRPPPCWTTKISIFGDVTVAGFNIWCSVQNFIKIGQFFTEIWRFNDFQNGGRPPSWILHICIFPVALVSMPFCFLIQNFAEIGQSVNDNGQKSDFQDGGSRHLEFLKFQFLVTWLSSGSCFSVPNFIKIGWFFTELWWFSDLHNGGRPPSWICYDVIILHRRTHFRCPNIVLKFLDDWCCSFRDTCNVIRHPCGCT